MKFFKKKYLFYYQVITNPEDFKQSKTTKILASKTMVLRHIESQVILHGSSIFLEKQNGGMQ